MLQTFNCYLCYFYSLYIHKQIAERNEIVQMASFYETGDSVRETLAKGHRSIDVEGLEREKVLVIVDSLKKYFADGENVRSDLDANKKMVDHAKAIGKRGYSILGDIVAFPYLGRIHDLIDYEMFLPATVQHGHERLMPIPSKGLRSYSSRT